VHSIFSRPQCRNALALAVAALLSACGGGGGDSGSTAAVPVVVDAGVPDAATALFSPGQAGADALVRDIEQRTRDLRLASGLTDGIKTGAAAPEGGVSLLAAVGRMRALAVTDYTSTLCSAGSASLDVADTLLARFDSNPNATLLQGDSIGLSASHCVVKAAVDLGTVALGDFGVGARIDGAFKLTLTKLSGADIVWTLDYSKFSYAPYGGTAFDALDAKLVFGTVGGKDSYALDIPATRFLTAPVVSSVGNTVTVASGQLRGKLVAASGTGYADYSFKGWVVDAISLKASAGTVTASGSAGAQAVVTAGATAYSVKLTVGGVSSQYSVVR
jgi:hypothetical protein